MPRYRRHYLETEIDYERRKLDHKINGLAVLFYAAIALALFALGMFAYTIDKAINYHP